MEHAVDALLMQAIQSGSSEAYEEVYRYYSDRIYRYCLVRLRDVDLARDVLQETFMVLWQGSSSYSGKSALSTWLFGVATNKLREAVRKSGRMGELVPELEETAAFDHGIEQSGLRLDVLKAIKKLPPEQQEVVILAFYADLRLADIADIQDVPLGTVKSRMFQAKKTLQDILR
jgi:RNA polymerase sigma-70 factor (ECF subfamily)